MNVLASVRRGWLVAVLVAVPVAVGVVFYAQSLPNQYTATAVISFSPRPNAQVGADVVSIVVPKYQVYVTSDSTVAGVASTLNVAKSQVGDHLDATIPQNTSNLQISVTGKDPGFVSRAANDLANATQSFARNDRLLEGTIVARAATPTTPSGPNRKLLDAAGVIVAVLLGAGVALLFDRVRPVVRTPADVAEATQLRVVGVLPRSKAVRTRRGGRRAQENTATNLRKILADPTIGSAIGNLRTQLERAARNRTDGHRTNVIAVTSPLPGEGKTTVASLLAVASARVEQSVLLIDGDLVRPSIAHLFGIAPRPGVAQALRSGDASRFATARQVLPRLHVMPTVREPEAGDFIAQGMSGLLAWASQEFDVVVVDTPPIFGNDSGQRLASLADSVLLVVRRGTRVAIGSEAAATLRSLDVHLVGAVANQI
ncbi:MAG TPA: P-loop NTPase, partial [Acidimicrobiia bacterium]|nr:P-loop NTPase [Acidimicrobiia bacterium]